MREVKQLTKELNSHKKTYTCKTPIDQKIIKTNKDVLFYTGIKSKALFDKFFEYIKPLVKRKWRGPSVKISIVTLFKNSSKKIGPKSKLSAREEFLLCLMKIRLMLLRFFYKHLKSRSPTNYLVKLQTPWYCKSFNNNITKWIDCFCIWGLWRQYLRQATNSWFLLTWFS